MESLLSCSQRMRYASTNEKQPAVPLREQMKVVIITPSVRIPRNLIRCESEGGGHSFDRENSDDMNNVEFPNQHLYQMRRECGDD